MAVFENEILRVEMLGSFNVFYGNTSIITDKTRNSKSVQLFKYLICYKNQTITQETLIRDLLSDDDSQNPINVLKNVVYRLRKMLIEVGLSKDNIKYEKSAYGFFPKVPLEIDSDNFKDLCVLIKQEPKKSEDEILNLCVSALTLYKGEFLPSSSGEPWVVEFSLAYQELYISILITAYEILKKTKDFTLILEHLLKGTLMYPYEESVYLMHIHALHLMNRSKDALFEYNKITSMLYNDLGIGPSENMLALHTEITSSIKDITHNIVDVRDNIGEIEYGEGAFFCNLAVFSNVYCFVVRHMERSGKSVFLMLCTLSENDGSAPATGVRLNQVTQSFHTALTRTCRRGDVYTRYSATQFLIMLLEINQESCDTVASRLRSSFYKMPKMHNMRIDCKCISAIDLEHIVSEYDKSSANLDW